MLSLTESDGAMNLITLVENGGIGGNRIAVDLKEKKILSEELHGGVTDQGIDPGSCRG